jgi:hypothetical protein
MSKQKSCTLFAQIGSFFIWNQSLTTFVWHLRAYLLVFQSDKETWQFPLELQKWKL